MIKNLNLLFIFTIIGCKHPESNEFNRFNDTKFIESTLIEQPSIEQTLVETDTINNSYKVIGIKDGDTFQVLIDGKEQVVRLEHIDCPEKKQPFGTKAKQFASDLCFGQFVHLNHKKKYDRNRRLIAEIILTNGINVNKELVNNGLAWHFKKYSVSQEYANLEINARNNKVGLWSENNQIPPWEWRKK